LYLNTLYPFYYYDDLSFATINCSDEVFQCFYGDEKSDALLHGHSYTSNPITCAASLEAMRQLRHSPLAEGGHDSPLRIQNSFSDETVRGFSLLPGVLSAMSLGSVLAVELKSTMYVQEVVSFLKRDKIHVRYDIFLSICCNTMILIIYYCYVIALFYSRPLGNVVYIMATPLTSTEDKERLVRCINRSVTKAIYSINREKVIDKKV